MYAFDGNLNQAARNLAHTALGELNSWIQVDLVQTAVINRVKIYNRSDGISANRLKNVLIEIADSSDMSLNPRSCASFSEVTDKVTQIENSNCTYPMVGRYVRLTQHNDEPLNICEMQVYGFYK